MEGSVELLAQDVPTLVGIGHGFSFPIRYFEAHGLKPSLGMTSSMISNVVGLRTTIMA